MGGFSSTNKEHTGTVSSEDFARLTDLWSIFDKHATGWIDIYQLCFLIFMLEKPLGRSEFYQSEIQSKLDQDEDLIQILNNKDEGMVNRQRKFLVNQEHNMVLKYSTAIELAQELRLPIYSDHPKEFKCHFRDVCKRLYRLAMKEEQPDFNPNGIRLKQIINLSL